MDGRRSCSRQDKQSEQIHKEPKPDLEGLKTMTEENQHSEGCTGLLGRCPSWPTLSGSYQRTCAMNQHTHSSTCRKKRKVQDLAGLNSKSQQCEHPKVSAVVMAFVQAREVPVQRPPKPHTHQYPGQEIKGWGTRLSTVTVRDRKLWWSGSERGVSHHRL